MDSMAAQPLHAEEKGNGSFELCSQEQHLEVEEGLLVHREVGLACRRGGKTYSEGSCQQLSDPGYLLAMLGGKRAAT